MEYLRGCGSPSFLLVKTSSFGGDGLMFLEKNNEVTKAITNSFAKEILCWTC